MREPEEKLFSYRRYFGGAIFREPRKGMSPRFGVFMVCVGLLLGPARIFLLGIGMGAAHTAVYSAEALPKHKTKLAGCLRLAGMSLSFSTILLMLAALLINWRN